MTRARLFFLVGAVLIVVFALGASLARAEAVWEAFEARCLAPMEDAGAPDTDGLAAQDPSDTVASLTATLGTEPLSAFAPPDGAYTLLHRESEACWVVSTEAEASDAARAETWRASALDEGRYEAAEPEGTLLSTVWREPKLQVVLFHDPDTGRMVLSAEDTDLEA